MTEIWKDIEGFVGMYQISNLGRVRSLNRIDNSGKRRKGMVKKTHYNDRTGYMSTLLCNAKKPKRFYIHRLVATAFIPNLKNKTQVNHIDGDKTNNNVTNLEWVTQTENLNHAYRTGINKNSGENSFRSKLTEDQVREIRKLREEDPKKYTFQVLGDMFNLHCRYAYQIVNKMCWKHIS